MPQSPRALPRARTTILATSVAALAALFLSTLTGPAAVAGEPALPSVVAALGDSITRAPLTEGAGVGTGINSWSTGTSPDVQSHLLRIDALRGTPATAYNLAEGGTTSAALAAQARSAVELRADYVTILSGSNNICLSPTVDSLPDAAVFGSEVGAALRVLAAGRPSVRILLASVPSLLAVYDAGKDSPRALAAWAYFGRCPVLLADPLSQTPEAVARRAAVEAKVVEMNKALADACRAVAQCTYDDGAVYANRPSLADLSPYDYFHPSISGQARLAAATWGAVESHGLFGPGGIPPVLGAPAPSDDAPAQLEWIENTDDRVRYAGTWKTTSSSRDHDGSISYNSASGAAYSLTFRGTQVSIVTRKTPTSGIAEVSIDGEVVGRFDSYAETAEFEKTVFTSARLVAGTHTVTVVRTGTKSPDSGGRNLILDAFVVE
ncbi:GDSL-type esterase/lipase family protein [Microbacterium sp. AZCO]|uniref:GDSL-type esterase/lipase family protein n=1 Tax=Microbacterium sp. AZCO TaxID=3142976 RepID=UPI0031F422C6